MGASLADQSYAVVDCETTGLFPGAHHRIIEIAVVHVDGGRITNEWSTLVNPDRDLGETGIHGIYARDVADAPRFGDVAGTVLELLGGRVFVAHNARFDSKFVEAELDRTGHDVAPLPVLCTIAMAHRLGLLRGSSRLANCCETVGVAADVRHEALGDARLAAQLLQAFMREASAVGLDALSTFDCPPPPDPIDWPTSQSRREAKPRNAGAAGAQEPAYLSRLAERHMPIDGGYDVNASTYAELLDRALEDRQLSTAEKAELASAAESLGLSGTHLAAAHSSYMDSLCRIAAADGVITDRERRDLELVAGLLGIEDLDQRLEKVAAGHGPAPNGPDGSESQLAGMTVCFTGKLLCEIEGELVTRERAQELAEAAGMVVSRQVTKKVDILVVADPDSLSGKAKRARRYGTRIIAEASFWPLIGVTVS